MLHEWLFVIGGLAMLVIGGDLLVRGAVSLAMRMGISALVVSLTVVAFGTSAPELLIAIEAALDGVPELALGNVVGSNTANVLLVLGIPAFISGFVMTETNSQKNYCFMITASLIFIGLCFTAPLGKWQGAVMLSALAFVLFLAYRDGTNSREKQKELENEVVDERLPKWKIATFLLIGLVSLPLGASFLIRGAVDIAKDFGVSEAAIGLTLVALGTSLPELATTIMAGIRRQTDIAIGSVLGSNMFNLLAIIGVATFFAPIPVPASFVNFDLWVMLSTSLVLAPFVLLKLKMARVAGLIFILCYIGYIIHLLG